MFRAVLSPSSDQQTCFVFAPTTVSPFSVSTLTLSSKTLIYFIHMHNNFTGRDSTVGIATRHWLDNPGIEYRWGRDFPHPSRSALRPTQPPIQRVPGLFPGSKAAGVWRRPPTPYSAEVEGRVQLYINSPSGLSWPAVGWTLLYLSCTLILLHSHNSQCVFNVHHFISIVYTCNFLTSNFVYSSTCYYLNNEFYTKITCF